MSKAFTREDDPPAPEPKAARRAGPSHVTARGRERLLARAALATDAGEAAARGVIQQVEAAQVVPARAADDHGPVRFGDVVTLLVDGVQRRYQIVSADEAELAPEVAGIAFLGAHAPLARALIGAEVGEVSVIELPDGAELEVELLAVDPAVRNPRPP